MKTTAVIMQPTYLPWVGYFDLIDQADVFVFLDDAHFSKQSWHHRNQIRTPSGLEWLSVPVRRAGRLPLPINEAEIAAETGYARKHVRSIEVNYCCAPHFKKIFPRLAGILMAGEKSLALLNMLLVQWIVGELGITVRFEESSSLAVGGRRSELMVNICQRLGADVCLSPIGSAAYLADEYDPSAHALELCFQHYQHPEYRQMHRPFLPYASTIDLLFNEGDRALEIIRSGRRKCFTATQAFRDFAHGPLNPDVAV